MKKYIRLFIGINIYALTINLLQTMELGMGSFDSLTLEVQNILNLNQFGDASFILHFIFFVILIVVAKIYNVEYRYIILSLFSIFILTRCVNAYSVLNLYFEKNIASVLAVILSLNFGLYLIASTNLIIAPFDKFVVETSNYFSVSLGKSRIICDITLLIIVIIINLLITNKIDITLFTFIITFGTGFNIGIYEWLEHKIKELV